MPRMEKVRLVGVRYDSMRKHYEDTTLDLMNGAEPAHTLLTLMNGGGKGLLLQMIFQLLLPLSKWGAKGENRIEALFYNERKQFMPYTFHVVIEWRLDTDPVRWLTTGIAVSASEKSAAAEADYETAEPRFLLYTLEQIKPGRYEIEDLPLYDRESRTAVSMDEWKTYLDARRADFTTYTRTQTRDYFELLRSYDIDRKEWETLRDVNRQEGGVEAFFRKGLDNRSLFHDLIIPEIGKHMASTDEEGHPGTLLDIFKHNASIVQHLPKLIRREEGYRLLLQAVEPVMSSLEHGAGHAREEREHQRQGAYLRHAMGEWLGEQTKEKRQWESELATAEEKAKELSWSADNLDYAEKHREIVQLEQELTDGGERLERAAGALADGEAAADRAKAVILWNERAQASRDEERHRQELELLQNAEEHRHVKDKQQQAQAELREEWRVVAASWRRSLSRYAGFVGRLEAERARVSQERALLNESLKGKYGLLGQVRAQLQALNQEMLEMERGFGRLAIEAPEKLTAQLMKQLEQLREGAKAKELERAEAEREKEALLVHAAQLQEQAKQAADQAKGLERTLRSRAEQEKDVRTRLSAYLRAPMSAEVSHAESAELLAEARRSLVKLVKKQESELAARHQQLWTHQLDSSLAKKSFWIPNQELHKLKEELEAQGLTCYYGTELLGAMTEEERISNLTAYPLLPYSLVAHQADWKRRDKARLSELLMRAPVPIYLRERMNDGRAASSQQDETPAGNADAGQERAILAGAEPDGRERTILAGTEQAVMLRDGALLLAEQGALLVRSGERWESWKQELAARNDELLEGISLLQEELEQGRTLDQEARELAAAPNAASLQASLEQALSRQAELEGQGREAEEERRRLQLRIGELTAALDECAKQIAGMSGRLSKLDGWAKRMEQGRGWREQKQGIEGDIATKEAELKELGHREEAMQEKLSAWSQSFKEWRWEQERVLEQVRRYAPEAAFSFSLDDQQSTEEELEQERTLEKEQKLASTAAGSKAEEGVDEPTELFVSAADKLGLLAAELESLSASLEANNRKMTELRIHIDYKAELVSKKEAELDAAYVGWRQESWPEKPLEVARSEHEARKAEYRNLAEAHKAARETCVRLEAKLEAERAGLARQERDIRKKHGRGTELWMDVELSGLRAELEQEMARNRSIVVEYYRLLKDVEATIAQLDKQMTVLSSQRISGEAVFDVPAELRKAVRLGPAESVRQWVESHNGLADRKARLDREIGEKRNSFSRLIQEQEFDEELRGSLQGMMGQIRWEDYDYARELLQSVKDHALFELESLAGDKSKAEQAQDLWTDRACYRVVSIAKTLKQMTSRMSFVNQGGHRYPLIRMDVRGGELPERPEDIRLLLREYFARTIEELAALYPDISAAPDAELEKRMSDSQIVYTALKSRYPILYVYKPQTTNVFLTESPKKHHYTEWETLNKGSVTEAKGSGGQLLAARTIVMMMLMTHKRQLRQSKMWSVLILDNPFGQAVSPHVLDPIFAIAENLHFQWIVLAPPELIKLDVSRRFPVFWELELKRHQGGEAVTERLQHGGRTFEGEFDLFSL